MNLQTRTSSIVIFRVDLLSTFKWHPLVEDTQDLNSGNEWQRTLLLLERCQLEKEWWESSWSYFGYSVVFWVAIGVAIVNNRLPTGLFDASNNSFNRIPFAPTLFWLFNHRYRRIYRRPMLNSDHLLLNADHWLPKAEKHLNSRRPSSWYQWRLNIGKIILRSCRVSEVQ